MSITSRRSESALTEEEVRPRVVLAQRRIGDIDVARDRTRVGVGPSQRGESQSNDTGREHDDGRGEWVRRTLRGESVLYTEHKPRSLLQTRDILEQRSRDRHDDFVVADPDMTSSNETGRCVMRQVTDITRRCRIKLG